MNIDPHLRAHLDALNALNLPQGRRAYLAYALTTATTAERQQIVDDAAREARRNAYKTRAAISTAFDEQAEREALRQAQKPVRKAPIVVTPELAEKVLSMRRDGFSVPDIATGLNIAATTIYRILNRQPEDKPIIPSKRVKAWEPDPLAPDDPRHGTNTGYLNFGCRCVRCTDARKAYRAERKANPTPRATASEHGTNSRYTKGCRCDECRAAATAWAKDYRERRRKSEK